MIVDDAGTLQFKNYADFRTSAGAINEFQVSAVVIDYFLDDCEPKAGPFFTRRDVWLSEMFALGLG